MQLVEADLKKITLTSFQTILVQLSYITIEQHLFELEGLAIVNNLKTFCNIKKVQFFSDLIYHPKANSRPIKNNIFLYMFKKCMTTKKSINKICFLVSYNVQIMKGCVIV